jgi:hypothetical protein
VPPPRARGRGQGNLDPFYVDQAGGSSCAHPNAGPVAALAQDSERIDSGPKTRSRSTKPAPTLVTRIMPIAPPSLPAVAFCLGLGTKILRISDVMNGYELQNIHTHK